MTSETPGTCSLNDCGSEVWRAVYEDFHGDPARLAVGDTLMVYVDARNCTETWEVVQAGPTRETVRVRLIDCVQEWSAS